MIIEQAFVALPELLLGNRYSIQDYEAGIVGVLSLAILQELNGRNANQPIQHLQAERRYHPNSSRRADLYVNIRSLMVANYGWRHHNWIEAKFYRNKSPAQRHATTKSSLQGQLIADLIRLTCLVPLTLGHRDSNGRYFLHVYDDEPQFYLPYQDHLWVRLLHEPGRQDIVVNTLAGESETAKSQFGSNLDLLQIQATVTNLVSFPVTQEGGAKHYWCILTRFDAFSVSLADRAFWIHANRLTGEEGEGDYDHISDFVSQNLGTRKASEQ